MPGWHPKESLAYLISIHEACRCFLIPTAMQLCSPKQKLRGLTSGSDDRAHLQYCSQLYVSWPCRGEYSPRKVASRVFTGADVELDRPRVVRLATFVTLALKVRKLNERLKRPDGSMTIDSPFDTVAGLMIYDMGDGCI